MGDTKSARGPTAIRPKVFEAEISVTWNAADESSKFAPVVELSEEVGRDTTMVPIFEIIISDYKEINLGNRAATQDKSHSPLQE